MNRSDVIFVDTGAWYALAVPSDANHAAATAWFAANERPLLTSDYVVDETLTLLRVRGEPRLAVEMGRRFFAGDLGEVHHLTPEDVAEAWQVFRTYGDKAWSFTDCSSHALTLRLGITTAFAFDAHFRQFGHLQIMPSSA
ncbi:MAG: PIN domain-containing protein [Planctomycetota bacterium]